MRPSPIAVWPSLVGVAYKAICKFTWLEMAKQLNSGEFLSLSAISAFLVHFFTLLDVDHVSVDSGIQISPPFRHNGYL